MKKIRCPLQLQSSLRPNSIAFISSEGKFTFKELDSRVQFAQEYLIASGIRQGVHVGIVSANSLDYIILLLALWRIGAVACLFNPRTPVSQIKKQAKSLNCKFFFDRVLPLRHPTVLVPAGGRVPAYGSPDHAKLVLNTPATIMLTSGSSGEPKAVVHTIGNHYFNALGSNQNIPVKPGDQWLLSLPLYHVSGLSIIWRCLLGGGTIVLESGNNSTQITHVSLVTTQLQRGMEDTATLKFLKKLKAILLGGGPISEELIQKAKKSKLPIFMTYGLTEMGSQVATTKKSQTTPHVLKYRELRILRDGEICVRGKTLFKGYFKNGKITSATDKNGWFHTGDLATFFPPLGGEGKGGGLKILGRKDNMFISGGENIYPEEIERALLNTGLVKQAVVIPVADDEFGFRPIAFINPTKPEIVLMEKLSKILPSFKIPKKFCKLPEQKTFKLNRQDLLRNFIAVTK